jgi:hypothetical protein
LIFSANMKDVMNLSVAKLKRIVAIKTKIERLQSQLSALVADAAVAPAKGTARRRRRMSAAGRRKISLAAKARWAKFHAAKKK